MGPIGLIRRVIIGHKRLFTGILAGMVAAVLLPGTLRPQTRAILAWDIGGTVFLVLVRLWLHASTSVECSKMLRSKRKASGRYLG